MFGKDHDLSHHSCKQATSILWRPPEPLLKPEMNSEMLWIRTAQALLMQLHLNTETIMYQTFRFYTYAVRKDFRTGARDNWNILWLIFHGVMIGIIIQEWTIFRTLNQNHKGSVILSRWTASQRWSIQNPLRWKKLSNQHRNFVYHTVHRAVHRSSITHVSCFGNLFIMTWLHHILMGNST